MSFSQERKFYEIILFYKNDIEFNHNEVGTGVIEVVSLLTRSQSKKQSIILMDEPALHLHPIQINITLSNVLKNITGSESQSFFISHSTNLPFLEFLKENNSLMYIRMKDSTTVHQPKKQDKIWLTETLPKLFYDLDPNVFYSKYVILVEGESELGLFEGVNSRNNKKLEVNDILVMSIYGKKNLETFKKLLSSFEIPHSIMVDKDALIEIDTSNLSSVMKALILIDKEKTEEFLSKLKPLQKKEKLQKFINRLETDYAKNQTQELRKCIDYLSPSYTTTTTEYADKDIQNLKTFVEQYHVHVLDEGNLEDLLKSVDSDLFKKMNSENHSKRHISRNFIQELDKSKIKKLRIPLTILENAFNYVSKTE